MGTRMSVDNPLERLAEMWEKMQPQARMLWEFMGQRLLLGQERYGGFRFGEVDLGQMRIEELGDFGVYMMAELYLRMEALREHERKGP